MHCDEETAAVEVQQDFLGNDLQPHHSPDSVCVFYSELVLFYVNVFVFPVLYFVVHFLVPCLLY